MVGTGPSGTALVRIETEWQDWTGSARTGRDGFVMEWQDRDGESWIGTGGIGAERSGEERQAGIGKDWTGKGRIVAAGQDWIVAARTGWERTGTGTAGRDWHVLCW